MGQDKQIEIWSAEGLAAISELIERHVHPTEGVFSQNELARKAGVAASTLTLLIRNKSTGGFNGTSLNSLLKIAQYLTDPATNLPFEVPLEGRWNKELCRFERIARGWEAMHPDRELPNARARHAIQSALKNDPGRFEAAGLLGSPDLAGLLKGEQPSLEQLSKLQKALGIPLDNLMGLYDLQDEEDGAYESASALLGRLRDKYGESFYEEIEIPMKRLNEILKSGQYTDDESVLISSGLMELEGSDALSGPFLRHLRDGTVPGDLPTSSGTGGKRKAKAKT